MYLQRLHLHNFRRFVGAQTFSIHRQLTVFAANNGAGKTSVLDAIALAFGPFLTRIPKISGNALTDKDISMERSEDEPFARIGATATGATRGDSPDNPLLQTAAQWDRIKRQDGTKKTQLQIKELLVDYPLKDLKELNNITDYYINHVEEHIHLPILAYYGCSRSILDIPQRRRGFGKDFPRFQAYSDCLNPKTNFRKLFEYFYFLEDLERREKEEQRDWDYTNPQLDAIRSAIKSFLPEYTNPRTELRPLRFLLDNTENGLAYNIELLSDGYKTAIATIMDIAIRMVEANPHLGRNALHTSGIVLIDEIELHLHPGWQQRIIPDLRRTFPNVQFIVTTHSPQVLSTVKPECIRTIQNDGLITEPNCKTYGAESKRILEELMGVPSRAKVLEETIQEFIKITDAGDWTSNNYRALRAELNKYLGETDPVLIEADIKKNFQELEAE